MAHRAGKLARLAAAVCVVASAGAWAQTGAPLKVYAAGEITPDRYSVVQRLWAAEWRSSFRVPRYADSGQAIAGLVDAAARAGADGVVNLYCTQDRGGFFEGEAYYCYGLAIKLK